MSHSWTPSSLADFAAWLQERFAFKPSDSAAQLFDRMRPDPAQGRPEVELAFDPLLPRHWADLAQAWDFLTVAGPGGRVLDIGCGDGWPSLPLANRGVTVVGVDPAPRRIACCEASAETLESRNASFRVMAGERLDLAPASFDAVVLCRSLEYCRDPEAVLREAFRVLRPGGRLRVVCESLAAQAREGRCHEIFFLALAPELWQFNFALRDPVVQRETIWSVVFSEALASVHDKIGALRGDFDGHLLQDPTFLRDLLHRVEEVSEAHVCELQHFTSSHLVRLLGETGFTGMVTTQDPRVLAERFLHGHELADPAHPFRERTVVESLCASLARLALQTPLHEPGVDGPVTAVKPGAAPSAARSG